MDQSSSQDPMQLAVTREEMQNVEFSIFPGDFASCDGALSSLRHDALEAELRPGFQTYYRLRQLVPLTFRQILQRRRKVQTSEDWYINADHISALAFCIAGEASPQVVIHPWPEGARFSFVLTHDVETRDGLRKISKIADLEEQLGLRSSWNFVPYKYKVDEGLVRDLQSRSFEIGVHGYNHDGKLYSSKKVFHRRVPGINAALVKYGAVGFRSPMVHRNLEWLQQLNIEYDASCFDIDPFQPMPGGVGTIWPFVAGKFIELPYTLPQDHTLFVALNERDARIWTKKRDFLIQHDGMVLMLTHPDYLTTSHHLDLYRAFLTETHSIPGCWHALPNQVAAWWRQREACTVSLEPTGEWSIRGPAATAGCVAKIEISDGDFSLMSMSACPGDRSCLQPSSSDPVRRSHIGSETQF
jgi:hypothetical protein